MSDSDNKNKNENLDDASGLILEPSEMEEKKDGNDAAKKPSAPNESASLPQEEYGVVMDPEMEAPSPPPPSSQNQEKNSEQSAQRPAPKKRMGEQLVDAKVITADQLNVALKEKARSGKMLGEVLVNLGFIDTNFLSNFISESAGVDRFDPSHTVIDPDAVAHVPKDVALKHSVLPLAYDGGTVSVAMEDPNDVMIQDKIRQFFPKGVQIKPLMATPKALAEAIDNAYGYATSTVAILKELESGQVDLTSISEEEAYSHPIVRLVNALVFDAVKMGASDIHFEPEEQFIRLRYRVDGVLKEIQSFHKEYWNAMAQRIKILSQMNIADKLNPQDGRFNLTVGGREADFRVSALPTVHGENFVLRILDKSTGIMPLSDLGFSAHNLKLIRRSQAKPEGIIIVTGPTGSGKSTSLYSMLNEMNTIDVNIMTLEDPVEYSLPMLRQAQVKDGTGLSFAHGVKALLRQDPDIIFVGEVRDGPTAEQALKAAMTGHQVYTTLHTNDSFGAIPRLLDLGLKPGMLAGAIIAVFAQRLVRRLCTTCKQEHKPDAVECKLLGLDPANPPTLYKAKGCAKCDKTGYRGRVAIAEILYFDDDLNDLVASDAHKSELRKTAMEKGFLGMVDDALLKVKEGLTDIPAVMKAVDLTDRMEDGV